MEIDPVETDATCSLRLSLPFVDPSCLISNHDACAHHAPLHVESIVRAVIFTLIRLAETVFRSRTVPGVWSDRWIIVSRRINLGSVTVLLGTLGAFASAWHWSAAQHGSITALFQYVSFIVTITELAFPRLHFTGPRGCKNIRIIEFHGKVQGLPIFLYF